MSSYRLDVLDYPTAWAIQRTENITHDYLCSAGKSEGLFLCDCGAIILWWQEYRQADIESAAQLSED